jgi:hypothetical protein
LRTQAGRQWPALAADAGLRAAASLPALWLAAALETRSPWRGLVFAG